MFSLPPPSKKTPSGDFSAIHVPHYEVPALSQQSGSSRTSVSQTFELTHPSLLPDETEQCEIETKQPPSRPFVPLACRLINLCAHGVTVRVDRPRPGFQSLSLSLLCERVCAMCERTLSLLLQLGHCVSQLRGCQSNSRMHVTRQRKGGKVGTCLPG